eukprot:scaffold8166_cov376-Prasinococcus_capsulatus_cf.AAC.3
MVRDRSDVESEDVHLLAYSAGKAYHELALKGRLQLHHVTPSNRSITLRAACGKSRVPCTAPRCAIPWACPYSA